MATPLDLSLIDAYTHSMNVPLPSQKGFACQADSAGTNVEYVGPQTLAGAGSWNGKSHSILVGGSGARTIALGAAPFIGYEVRVIDAAGTSDTGTITISAGTTQGSSQTITTTFGSGLWCYTAADTWTRIA